MKLHVMAAGPISTNAYLLTDGGSAVLIDAPPGIWAQIEPILQTEGARLTELWLTHGHWDHTLGGPEVVRATGAKVSGHRADQRLFEEPRVMSAFLAQGLTLEPIAVDRWLEPGQRLAALGLSAEVREVPGHCPGSVLFYFAEAGAAFVGDALFNRGIGRTDLPGGDFPTLEQSIRGQIYPLPGDTVIYPGHGPASTVAEEKAENPFVQG